MSNFDNETLARLKQLCRIDCTPEEEEDILVSLKKVVEYIEQLKEVDTTNVTPCSYVMQSMSKSLMREDISQNSFPREQFLHNAPDQIGGMVRVPPIIKAL